MSPHYHSSLYRRVRWFLGVLGILQLGTFFLLILAVSTGTIPTSTWFSAISPTTTFTGIFFVCVGTIVFYFFIPWLLFHKLLPVRCPECANRIYLEIAFPPRYYCHGCGHLSDDGTMRELSAKGDH